jgi:hypothetical protein
VTVADGHAQGYDGVTNDYFLVQNHRGPEFFSPRNLPLLLARLRADGPPASPVFLGL